jgi:hypothetical protein
VKLFGVDLGGGRRARSEPSDLARLLERNAKLRDVFEQEPELRERLAALQRWQSRRLLRSHSDLRASPRYRAAVDFFFEELYSGGDPRGRDRDLQRVHRVMEALLPAQALHSLMLAIDLEILSQELDAEVARKLAPGEITVEKYAEAYRRAGRRRDRERQIALLDTIGGYLDQVVKKPIIRGLVRMSRSPAHAAGFGALQEFLERGLDAFEAMHGAGEFLDTLRERETLAMERMFAGSNDPFEFDELRTKDRTA